MLHRESELRVGGRCPSESAAPGLPGLPIVPSTGNTPKKASRTQAASGNDGASHANLDTEGTKSESDHE